MNEEHDALEWFSPDEARDKLKPHHKQENEIIERAEKYLAMEQL